MNIAAPQPGAEGASDRSLADMCREAIQILERSQSGQPRRLDEDAGEAEQAVGRLRDPEG